MMDLELRRRFFAEEIEAVGKLRSPALVDAFAAVPRERFLPPGPWSVLADADVGMGMGPARTRLTPDADPARIYHNIAVGIDPSRQLFNGQPSALGAWIDALELAPGSRVLHLGCGHGYYTAIIAHCVTSSGSVVALEADSVLAGAARANLATTPWVEVRATADAAFDDQRFDAILINAGVTHPQPAWLDALAVGGRMMVPLTSTMGPMGPIGKGLVFLVTREDETSFAARVSGVVAIYSAVGLRDDQLNGRLGAAMMAGPQKWAAISRLRRDPHDAAASCWLHDAAFCLSS
jgi:protein-L-isoaspartate(D-aspartate) O-methyltransferase